MRGSRGSNWTTPPILQLAALVLLIFLLVEVPQILVAGRPIQPQWFLDLALPLLVIGAAVLLTDLVLRRSFRLELRWHDPPRNGPPRRQEHGDGATTVATSVAEPSEGTHPPPVGADLSELLDAFSHGIIVHEDGKILHSNKALALMLGHESSELVGANVSNLMHQDCRSSVERRLSLHDSELMEAVAYRKDQTLLPIEMLDSLFPQWGPNARIVEVRDITEQKLGEDRFLGALIANPLLIMFVVQDGRFVSLNSEFARASGYGEHELLAMEPSRLVFPDDRDLVRVRAIKMLKERSLVPYEYRGVTKAGEVRWLREAVAPISYKGRPACLATTLDITEQKRSMEAAFEPKPRYYDVLDIIRDPVALLDAERRFVACNLAMSDLVGTPKSELPGRYGHELLNGISESAKNWLSSPTTWSTSRESCVYQREDRWFEAVVEAASQPRVDASRYVLTIREVTGSKRREEQTEERGRLLDGAIDALFLHGRRILLHSVHPRAQGEGSQGSSLYLPGEWSEFLGGTIEAMMSAVQSRDLYAVGHAQKVARIACAIGQGMGLDEKRVVGLRIAALLHDVGKVGVPADLLMKPGRLTEGEYSVVKVHCQVAFCILQPIDFPWPVAQIVLQHHEMFDGSGYPQGLSGEDILVEARILAVSERVTAMLSPRSYRSPVGPGAVINEIARWSGKLYDPVIAEVSIKVLREGSAIANA